MTVAENLELGGWLTQGRGPRGWNRRSTISPSCASAPQLAGTMSGGEQQMVAVARALMSAAPC